MTTTPTAHSRRWSARLAAPLLGAALLAGCATAPDAHPGDPFEPYNRSMTEFNENLDNAILKPVATAYHDVTPQPVRTGVGNFFGNLGDAWSFVNNVLQLRGREAYDNMVRFSVNTVLGLGGLLDIATEMGIDRRKQDFGLTMARWGVPSGPYLVLPFFGPSTVRDAAGMPVDTLGNLLHQVDPASAYYSLYGLRVVDRRATLLNAKNLLDTAALDSYSFTRDAYLQLRRKDAGIYDDDDNAAGDGGGRLPEEY